MSASESGCVLMNGLISDEMKGTAISVGLPKWWGITKSPHWAGWGRDLLSARGMSR